MTVCLVPGCLAVYLSPVTKTGGTVTVATAPSLSLRTHLRGCSLSEVLRTAHAAPCHGCAGLASLAAQPSGNLEILVYSDSVPTCERPSSGCSAISMSSP